MKTSRLAVSVCVCCLVLNLAHAKPKKPEVSAVFQNAKYVYVEAEDGDALKPGLYPEDRQAIFDVQDSIRDWKRYAITYERTQADLVFVVRKGRLVGAQVRAGISPGPRPQSGQSPNQDPTQTRNVPEVGADADIGPPEDLLRVFIQSDGKLTGPVWSRELEGGLDAPTVQLVKQLKAAVEHAYPQAATSNPKP